MWPRDWSSDVCSSDLAKAAGTTLVGRLDELARRDGLHATSQLSIRVEDLSLIEEMMQRLRQSPQIGRASCRERASSAGEGQSLRRREDRGRGCEEQWH